MENIRWIVQQNLIHEKDFLALKNACDKYSIEFQPITIIPFSDELPQITLDSKENIYYGSTTLMYSVYKKLNQPKGLFFDEITFSMENYFQKWGSYMLNYQAEIISIKEFCSKNLSLDSLFFIRPNEDDKSFDGTVKTFEEILNWHKNLEEFGNEKLNKNTKIVVGQAFNINKEWRNFIINGKVVASTLYRKDFKLNKNRNDKPDEMIDFVENRCKEYIPHSIFAMDIALCGDTFYIIECGCLNSCGFYDADINKIVQKVSEYLNKK